MKYIKRIAIVLLTLPDTAFRLFDTFVNIITSIMGGCNCLKIEYNLYDMLTIKSTELLRYLLDWLFVIVCVYYYGFTTGLMVFCVVSYIFELMGYAMSCLIHWIYERFYEDR